MAQIFKDKIPTPVKQVRPKASDADNSVDHVVCVCDVDVSLCGLDVSELSWTEYSEKDACVVCSYLEATTGCETCDKE